MDKAMGVLVAGVVTLGVSVMAQQQCACADRPDSGRSPRLGVYTAAPGRVTAAAVGASDRR